MTIGRSLLAAAVISIMVPAVKGDLRAQGFTFAGVPWGAPRAEVERLFRAQGLKVGQPDKDGDLPFTGELVGYETAGFILLAQGKVQKITISLLTPDNRARTVYREMKESLTEKYGAPKDAFEYFRKPYYEGDGFEEQAIKLGKATFASFWECKAGCLSLEITENLTVRIAYEGPEWPAEADRRKKAQTRIFE